MAEYILNESEDRRLNLFQHYNAMLDKEINEQFGAGVEGLIRDNTSESQEELEIFQWRENCHDQIEDGIDSLNQGYSAIGLESADSLDFNEWHLRCAYLYLYSTSCSHMVLHALTEMNNKQSPTILKLIESSRASGSLNITSVGGGPGSDPVGILSFLDRAGYRGSCPNIKVNMVDKYEGWEKTFNNVMEEYRVNTEFMAQDLLESLSSKVADVLGETHLVSMVKLVSAIYGNPKTEIVLKTIFNLLRPGTLVLIIDNAGGGYLQGTLDIAFNNRMTQVFGPDYKIDFRIPPGLETGMTGDTRFNKNPQTWAKIAMVVLKKDEPTMVLSPSKIPPLTMKGYIHDMTRLLTSRSTNKQFFILTIQTREDEYKRTVCFDIEKRQVLEDYAESGTAVRLDKLRVIRSQQKRDELDMVINEDTEVTCCEVDFLISSPTKMGKY